MTAVWPSQPHLPARQILHDFLAAAADGVDLDLAVDALDPDAAHVAGAAENLHRFGGAERHGLGRLVLQHADLGDRTFALIEPPRQHFKHRLRRRDLLRHVDQLVPDHLMLRQRFSKRVPLLGVFHRVFEADPRRRGAAGRHGQPLAVEIVHDDLEAAALLAEQIAGWHAAIVEMQGRGIRGPPAHLLERRAGEPRRVALDHQQADAAGPGTAGAHRRGDIIGAHARGDKRLLAVDHVSIAVAARRGAQVRDVGAAARLGDGQRRNLPAGQNLGQHPRLEFRTAGARDRRRADRIALEAGGNPAGAGPRQLLDRDDPHEIVDFGAAIFFRKAQAQQPDGGGLLIEQARESSLHSRRREDASDIFPSKESISTLYG